MKFAPWGGPRGQARLATASVVVVGVGALGGACANLLARAGVGRLRLVDPDRPELRNLHRQLLYNEADTRSGLSKAHAAADYLAGVNHDIALEAVEDRLTADNAHHLLGGADLVVDGLDSLEPRLALNQACHDLGIPWVHASLSGSRGQLMVIRSGGQPCLRCWSRPGDPGKPGRGVDQRGVIGPTPLCLAGLQANEALKLLLGQEDYLLDGLLVMELWPPAFKTLAAARLANPHCPVCGGDARPTAEHRSG